MKKIFVIDTNILLSNPNSIYKFKDNDVVIPISVIEEIDKFKKDQSETGRNAREVSRILDRLRERGSLASGIKLTDKDNSGTLYVYLGNDMDLLPSLLEDSTDNHILAIGLSLRKKFDTKKIVVITKDSNLRIKADAFGLASEDFEADKVDISHLYSGVKRVQLSNEELKNIEEQREFYIEEDLHPNEFVVAESPSGKREILGMYDAGVKAIRVLPPLNQEVWGIRSRNVEQALGLAALMDDRIKLVTLTGSAGTGKTLLAIAAGLSKTTDEDKYHKMLVARPIFALGKDIGFLPGDIDEKLLPWMQPIYDGLEFLLGSHAQGRQKRFSKSYHDLIEQGILEVEPLTYIRGRSLPHAFFIVDESQNLTPHEIKTIITRAGEGTKIILTGDPFQIDNPYIDSTNNGLTYVIEKFKNSEIAAHVSLTKGERSKLASLAAELL